jgi:nickel/cobalt transporter (NiCoT) family protein
MAPSMTWLPLCLSVFALGLRHGLDADHLATIDGLTRFNAKARPGLAVWCGALFSAGHGCVVILVALTTGTAAAHYTIPAWARDFGAWVSIAFLVALGLLNLALVLGTPPDAMVKPAGPRSRLLSRLTRTTHPIAIAGIGALFAVSFDTLSQAVLFSAIAVQFGGWGCGAFLGVLFTLGMLLVDGLNGLWVTALLRRADRRARMASRAIGILVAALSFGTAAIGVVRYFSSSWDSVMESRGTLIGVFLLLAVALGSAAFGLSCPRRRLRSNYPGEKPRESTRGSRANVTMTLRRRRLDLDRDQMKLSVANIALCRDSG